MKIKTLISCIFILMPLVVSSASVRQNKGTIAKQLGWLSQPNSGSLCLGSYLEPLLIPLDTKVRPIDISDTAISADYGSFSSTQRSILKGKVVVSQPGRRLSADKASIYPDSKTGKIKSIDLYGNIHIYEPGRLIVGKKAHLNLTKENGQIENVLYRIFLSDHGKSVKQTKLGGKRMFTGTAAWGRAKKAIQKSKGYIVLENTSYTTCSPAKDQWKLFAKKITLDKKSGKGFARNASLCVKGVPVFFMPYISFPLTKKRKSGFLFPTIGFSSGDGAKVSIPYYWNIAPNYDDTFAPKFYSARGVLFQDNFRYLEKHSLGEIVFAFMPQDREFKKLKKDAAIKYPNQFGLSSLLNSNNNRYLFNWKGDMHYSPHWSSDFEYSKVSDDYYFQDFGSVPSLISANQLLSQAHVNYESEHWYFSGILQNYDTLHAVNRQPINNVYSKLPQLKLSGYFPNQWHGLDFEIQSEGTYFTRPFGPIDLFRPIKGGRFAFVPSFMLPTNWSWGYIEPKVQFDATYYTLQNQLPGRANTITRTLPIVDVDSSIYFDKIFRVGKKEYRQTLEPRIFYLYIPFRSQRNIPLFDSAAIPFTFDELFRTNRFSGKDRISDANQVSLALTTRVINENTGEELLKASIGQIYYFRNRRVTLCSSPGCSDLVTSWGGVSNTESTSPVVGEINYHVNQKWSANGGVAWDPHRDRFSTGNFSLSYSPSYNYIIDLGYSFIRGGDLVSVKNSAGDLHQASIGFSLPINNSWSSVGVFNYNIGRTRPQTYLAGLEYQTCCWAVRVVAGRTFSNIDQNGKFTFHNAVYLQWQLKGLGNFGLNNVSSLLSSYIKGYQDPF